MTYIWINPVIDIRCPKTKQVLDKMGITSKFTVPTIEPILIHCAREISEREDLQGEEKIITTPCKALADMGNALKLPKTIFMTWNHFLAKFDDRPTENQPTKQLKESPIPPGFFEGLNLTTVSLTGEDEIREYFEARNSREMTDDTAFVQNIINMVGLNGFEKAYPAQLSGGMQQRVAIARAFAYEPSFIMMDEPFAALDYFTRTQMQKELKRLQEEQGASILFVTHSIDEALLLGDKIVMIENGCIKSEMTIETNGSERNLLEAEFVERKRKIQNDLGE